MYSVYWREFSTFAHGFHPDRSFTLRFVMISLARRRRSVSLGIPSSMYFFRFIFCSSGSYAVKSIYQVFPVCNLGSVYEITLLREALFLRDEYIFFYVFRIRKRSMVLHRENHLSEICPTYKRTKAATYSVTAFYLGTGREARTLWKLSSSFPILIFKLLRFRIM